MRFIVILCFLLFAGNAYANFFVLYNKNTGEVMNYSEKKDSFEISSDDKNTLSVKEIKGNISDFGLDSSVQDYKLSGDKFIVNTKKISERADAKQKQSTKSAEMKKIENQAFKTACDTLVSAGEKFTEVKCTDFQ